MQWKSLVGSPWAFVGSTAVNASGLLDAFEFWRKTVGDMSPVLQGVLIGGGSAVMAISALIFLENKWALIRANAQRLAGLGKAMLALIFVGGIAYGLTLVDFSRSESRWMHPTLSAAESGARKS